jgi:glycine cleavage system aminomethyltransferase T
MTTATLRRTPLFECHRESGAKLVPFAGWEMPVQYSSVIEEHRAVREAAGLFDVSHMGQIAVRGPGAERFLDALTPNHVANP